MKSLLKITLAILMVISIVAIVASIYFYNAINRDYQQEAPNFGGNPKYHFSLVLADIDSDYISQIIKGVYDAAKAYNAAVEFHGSNRIKEGLTNSDYVTIARLSNLDGIIVNSIDDPDFFSAISKATQENMAVTITGFSDIKSTRSSFVGTNQYEYGVSAALLTSKAISGPKFTEVAIIQSRNEQNDFEANEVDLFMAGFSGKVDSIKTMRVIAIKKTSSKLLGAEDTTQNILKEYPEVNVIFCMNAKDTIAAAQAVVDRNKVGAVYIVGTDVTDEILDFIDKGIIYGVIDRNAYDIGYKSIESLINHLEGNLQSSYIDVDMDIITKENVRDYMNKE